MNDNMVTIRLPEYEPTAKAIIQFLSKQHKEHFPESGIKQ
jgi:hypothetical protein